MNDQRESTCLLETALRYAGNGFTSIPITPGKKSPPLVKWKRYQREKPNLDDYRAWFADGLRNIAIMTGEIVVADLDDPALLGFVMEKCGETTVISKTPSGGFHLWYRKPHGIHVGNRVRLRGRHFDLRAEGGYALVAPSRTEIGAYEWLGEVPASISALPVFRLSWTHEPTTTRSIQIPPSTSEPSRNGIARPEAYCLRIQSIQGQNGSRGLVRVVCVLRDARRSPEQIFDFIQRIWNPRCARPEWSEREIVHAITRHCGAT